MAHDMVHDTNVRIMKRTIHDSIIASFVKEYTSSANHKCMCTDYTSICNVGAVIVSHFNLNIIFITYSGLMSACNLVVIAMTV